VDATGAGDAFVGVLAAQLAAGRSLEDSAQWAADAGVDVRDGVRVLGVDGIGVATATGIVEARVVIGADGSTSVIAKAAGHAGPRRTAPAVEAEVDVDFGLAEEWAKRVRFDLGAVPGGYGLIFPKAGQLSIALCTLRPKLAGLRAMTERNVAEIAAEGRPRVRGVRSHLVPVGGPRGPIANERVLLAGDAAGVVDPFTGERIYAALQTGTWAAEAARAMLAGALGASAAYRQRVHGALTRDYAWADRIGWVVYRLPGLAHAALMRNSLVQELFVGVITGGQRYRSLLKRIATYPAAALRGYGRARASA
jgi:flavin-dependent dehydrogenase